MKIAIVGGGISGMSTAFLLGQKFPGSIDVFEKEAAPGGTIGTLHEKGFIVEKGPNGFLSGKPTTLQLAELLGISESLVSAAKAAAKRYICRGGSLLQLPEGPGQFLFSSVLSPGAKVRMLREPFVPKMRGEKDETVAEFGARRLGREAVEYLLDPMVSGVFAGAVERLSLKSCFPRIHELEREYGSLVRAMVKLKAKKASPPGRLTSFREGMGYLIRRLAESGNFRLHTGVSVRAIAKKADGFYVDDGPTPYAAVVLAIPAYELTSIEFGELSAVRRDLAAIPYPPIAVAAFSLPGGKSTGFGFLVPSREKAPILGALFNSNIFANRAPADRDLASVLLGGDRRHEVRDYPDAKVVDIAARELSRILRIRLTDLESVATLRWPRAIPQYYPGHQGVVAKIEKIVAGTPGLFVTGNAFYGIGINDCTRAAFATARKVGEFFGARQ